MKHIWSEILVPAAIVGATLAQTLGVEAYRAGERADVFLHRSPLDTIVVSDKADTLEDDYDFFFGEENPEDTTPKIHARDTMKVPDSLKVTDPFLYQWYVAVKDSFTHRTVVDSLKAEGDSIIWPVIDSLYLADSTAVAKEKFDKWYASLSKAERRRYDYEQRLPAILHRQDSILHRKDSLKRLRDSIIENTPRILETPYIPDSLHFRRLISWKHSREFNDIRLEEWDTTFNYHFEDYPYMREDLGGTFLGVAGSPVQTYNFFKRDNDRSSVSFYRAMESWTYSPGSIPMFNTKTPYTELEYNGTLLATSSKESDNIRLFTTQNILPALNIAMEFKRYGGLGILQHENTINKTSYVAGNWLGKRYLAHFGFIHNAITREENGGLTDLTMIRDTTIEVREISVVLSDAKNKYKKNTLFLDQSLRIPFTFIERLRHRGDSTYVPSADEGDITTAFIGSSHEFSTWSKLYTDGVSASNTTADAFYGSHYYINPSKSADSLRVAQFDNKVFIRLQPWKEDFFISRIEGGVGDRFRNHYMLGPGDYLRASSSTKWNSLYAYAGAEGMINRYFQWDALGQYTFAGSELNDFSLVAHGKLNLYPFRRHPDSPLSLSAKFEQTLLEPDYYEQNFFSNHYRWSNDFSKVSTTRIEAALDIPRWKLQASAGYALLANNIYYDTDGIAKQNTTPMSVASAYLRKEFVLANNLIHLDNRFLLQYSSNQNVVPLPLLAANLRWFLQFPVVSEDVMKMQIGVNTHYNTAWYAPAYNPVAGVFINQDTYKYGNCPRFDVFLNMQWKTACIFVKLENAGQGWPMERHDYFSAANYIHTTRAVKLGIYWPFHPPLGESKTLSSRASSGFGGGGGDGGGLGGLKSGLGGLRGGR